MNSKPLSDELFRLVKSLTVNEAGYLSSHLKKIKNKQSAGYAKLVMLLRSQETYNEEALKKGCRGKEIKNNFSYHKNALHDYVLDSLIAFHAQGSITYQVFRYMEASDLLSRKSLFTQGLKLLSKAYDVAVIYQKHAMLLQVVEAQRRVLKQTKEPGLEQKLEANSCDKKEVLRKIENEDSYAALNDKAFILYREYEVMKSDEKMKELEKFMKDRLLQNESLAITFDSKLRFHYIYSHYYQLKKNFEKGLKHREAAVKLWNTSPQFKQEMPERYRTDLSNLLSLCLLTRNYKDFETLLDDLEKIKNNNPEEDAATFREVYHLRQLYLLNIGKKEQALALLPEIEEGLKRFGDYINPSRTLSFYYNIVSLCFVCRRYRDALVWANRITTEWKNKKVRTHLVDFTSIFELIFEYEGGKYTLVEYHARNIRARLKKNGSLYELEHTVLLFMKRLVLCEYKNHPPAKKQEKLAAIWLRFLKTLEQIAAKPENNNLLGLEEIILWVKDKVSANTQAL